MSGARARYSSFAVALSSSGITCIDTGIGDGQKLVQSRFDLFPIGEQRQAEETEYEPACIDGVRRVALISRNEAVRQSMAEHGIGPKIEQVLDLEYDGRAQHAFKRLSLLLEHDRQVAVFLRHVALDGGGIYADVLQYVAEGVLELPSLPTCPRHWRPVELV